MMARLADIMTGKSVHFGPFEFDVERRLLSRDGQEVRIGSRSMDILIALLENPGLLVSTQDLIARTWPRSIAVEANLRAQVFSLRRALGDGDNGHRYIQNVPGRGYRFVCRIENHAHQLEEPPAEMSAESRTGESVAAPVAWKSAPAPPRLIGRDEVIAALLDRLPHRRLITLVGPGGIGKTTVAAGVAESFRPVCPDGVHWIDFGTLAESDSPAEAVALALNLANFGSDLTPAVIAGLKHKRVLLVFDCCDRVVGAAAALAERILSETDGVTILATSREILRATGEQVVRLPPLTAPDIEELTAEQALTFPAIQLFVERAAAALGGFTLRDEDVRPVARICARLDGIALAIELAAGHLVAIELGDLARLLDDKFRLLAAGRRTALARHRTMHAVLEWSYETLSPPERTALLGLSIFEAEMPLDSLRAITADDGVSGAELAEAMSRLVDKSLVAARLGPEGLRYHLLDTTRAFALERLGESGQLPRVSRRHAEIVMDTLCRIETEDHAFVDADWFAIRRRELPDLRAALNWAYDTEEGAVLRPALTAAAGRIFLDLSLTGQARRRLEQAIAYMEQTGRSDPELELRLGALLAMAYSYTPGPVDRCAETLMRLAELAERIGATDYLQLALWGLWSLHLFRNEPIMALAFTDQFHATLERAPGAAQSLILERMAGMTLHLLGRHAEARPRLEWVSTNFDPAVHAWKQIGVHVNHGAMARIYLARLYWMQGELPLAERTLRDSLEALTRQGHAITQCHALFEVALPLYTMMGQTSAVRAGLATLRHLADERGLAIFQAASTLADLALPIAWETGDPAACRPAAQALSACRYENMHPWFSGLMAETAVKRGEIAQGIDWIAPYITADGTCLWQPETLRVRGELAARQAGRDDEARDWLNRARDLARRQGSPSLELRAVISLVGLERGRRPDPELKQALDDTLDRFAEGSESPDLKTARDLSRALAG